MMKLSGSLTLGYFGSNRREGRKKRRESEREERRKGEREELYKK